MYVFSQEGVHYSKLYAGSPKVRFILLITLMSFCLSNVKPNQSSHEGNSDKKEDMN